MSSLRLFAALMIGSVVVAPGCAGERTAPAQPATAGKPEVPPAPPPLMNLPASMTVKQRSTTPVPGSNDSVRLTIDDITRGQTMTSLASKDGKPIMSPTSMSEGQFATFVVNDVKYVLRLTELSNALIGEDFATFEIRESDGSTLTEREKIDRLLEHVAGLKEATFLRNGEKHTPEQAAEHLRSKLDTFGDATITARGFISAMATKSSLTGDPYEIVLPNGSTVASGDYLLEQLEKIEAASVEGGAGKEAAALSGGRG